MDCNPGRPIACLRKAIALHYLLDLPIEEVAHELDVPLGTVKSWLHRGRAALAASLSEEVRARLATPPAREVRSAGDRRTARRRAGIVAGVFAAVTALTVAGFVLLRGRAEDRVPPVVPGPSTTATATATPVTWRVAELDATSALIEVPFGPPVSAGEPIVIKGQQGMLYKWNDDRRFIWRPPGDSHEYQLTLSPMIGETMSKQEFLDLVNTWTWPR